MCVWCGAWGTFYILFLNYPGSVVVYFFHLVVQVSRRGRDCGCVFEERVILRCVCFVCANNMGSSQPP